MTAIRRLHRALLGLTAIASLIGLAGPVGAQTRVTEPTTTLPSADAGDPPITVVVTRFARRGCEKTLETLWQQVLTVRESFPGHLSTDFIRPPDAVGGPYYMIYRFDHTSHYQAWLTSKELAGWLKRLDAVTEGGPEYQYVSGLEAWVTPAGHGDGRLPERYKTTAVTWLAIFPLVFGVASVVNPLTIGLSALARTMLVTGIVVPAMSYVVMPGMTWVFQDWLYPPAPQCAG